MDGPSILGESRTFLGYYTDSDSIQKEIDQILHAIEDGAVSYKLKYAVPEPKLSLGKKLTNLLKLE